MKKLLPYLLILTFAFIGLKSLIQNPFYTSHDGFTHTARIAAYTKIFTDGQFPPRWAADLNGTLGSPIFVYSYQIPYLLGTVIHNLGVSYQDSFRIVMGISFILGSIGMYLWLKSKYGVLPGLTAAIFYMYVPYRFLNLYVRAAFAESFAYAVLPFIFLSIERYKESKNKILWWAMTALMSCAMLLSHNVVSAIFLPILFVWIIINFWKKWLSTLKLVAALFTGLIMSSFIYAPDLFERHFTRFDQGISYFSEHFVSVYQLVRSPWGYGFDFPGTLNDMMSFQLGLAQLLVLGVVVIILILKRKFNLEVTFFLGVLAIVLILMIEAPYSVLLWKSIPILSTIVDFPWRFLGLTAFIFAFLAAYLIKNSKLKLLVFILLIFAVTLANRNFMRINEQLSFNDAVFDNYTESSTAFNEYLPIAHKTTQIPSNITPVEIVEGQPVINLIKRDSNSTEFKVQTDTQAKLRVNRFFFPDTIVTKDGQIYQNWAIITDQTSQVFDDTGTIAISVSPPGGFFEVRFAETPLRNFANLVSSIVFIATLTVLVLSLVKRHVKK